MFVECAVRILRLKMKKNSGKGHCPMPIPISLPNGEGDTPPISTHRPTLAACAFFLLLARFGPHLKPKSLTGP